MPGSTLFTDAMALTPAGDGRYDGELNEHWTIGPRGSGATPLGRTQYSITGGPPSARGSNVVSDGRMSQPWARLTTGAIGWPGPIGSSPGGGSGGISGTTGLT